MVRKSAPRTSSKDRRISLFALWCTFAALALPVLGSSLSGQEGSLQAESPSRSTTDIAVVDAGRYPSLQAAFDALPPSGGVVRIPPGQYHLDRPLVLSRANTRVEGSGPATVLVNRCPPGEPTLVIRAVSAGEKSPPALWRVEITGLRLLGDPAAVDAKSSASQSGPGLVAENVNEIFIHGVTITHHGSHGIHLVNCYENPRIIACNITYNRGAGINIEGGHDIVLSANQLEENQIAVRCVDSYNLCMTGNNIDDHLGDGVVIENTYGSVLSGNMIEECQGAAIVLDRDCYGITISANVIAHNFGGGVRLVDAWGCALSANTFVLNGKDSVYIGPDSGRIALSGNSFCDSFIGQSTRRPGKENFAGGIRLVGTADISITGNQFSGLDGPAIVADPACRRLVIMGNIVEDVNRRVEGPCPAFDIPAIEGLVLQGNLLPAESSGAR